MKTQTQHPRTRAEIKQEIDTLTSQLRQRFASNGEEDNIIRNIRKTEAELRRHDQLTNLDNVNRKYNGIRYLAHLVYEAEQPEQDITNMDGSFHAVKVRKYPKLAALPYARAKWEDGRLTEITANGETFYMFRTEHDYKQPTKYTRPETFEDFCELNTILQAEITIEELDSINERVNTMNAEIDKAMKEYGEGMNALKYGKLSQWGLLKQEATHFYKYTPTR